MEETSGFAKKSIIFFFFSFKKWSTEQMNSTFFLNLVSFIELLTPMNIREIGRSSNSNQYSHDRLPKILYCTSPLWKGVGLVSSGTKISNPKHDNRDWMTQIFLVEFTPPPHSQIHQHFSRSFYAQRYQKRKKKVQSSMSICIFGIWLCKSCWFKLIPEVVSL